jgi:hypothetical protein
MDLKKKKKKKDKEKAEKATRCMHAQKAKEDRQEENEEENEKEEKKRKGLPLCRHRQCETPMPRPSYIVTTAPGGRKGGAGRSSGGKTRKG